MIFKTILFAYVWLQLKAGLICYHVMVEMVDYKVWSSCESGNGGQQIYTTFFRERKR
ncbi:hypothetical protein Hanom_Chr09g00834581 [Helianthus anomalus]